ncbi:MAG: serine--tRNA ligase [Patescibacteria group bacterium]
MLDIKYLRENLVEVKKALAKKHTQFDLEGLLKLDGERRELLENAENLRAKKNKLAKAKDVAGGKRVKEELEKLDPELQKAEKEFQERMAEIHNIPHQSVPRWQDGNKVEKTWGTIPKFDYKPKDHLELGQTLDIIDTQKASQISGSRFGFLKNQGALLEFSLIQYLKEKLTHKDFQFIVPPVLVKERAMFGTGFFPAEKNEFYKIEGEDLYLVGTAEVPLASLHADEIVEVPKKYAGFSSCFRKEAGSYGQDTRGIFRVHQFDKIEMFYFVKPEKSWDAFDELIAINQEIFQELELPYQLVNCCGGDLGAPNAKRIDIEVWIPSQNKYRELTSCSNDTDFQARRLNIKFKTKDGKLDYAYTVNDTALAMGRTIVALLENHQSFDKAQDKHFIKIPEVLQKYTGFKEIKK